MNPEQLAKSGSEHGEQRALFAWVKFAIVYGFEAANDMRCYDDRSFIPGWTQPVPELEWFHAIPNGGQRDKVTASKLKQEGVKRGVPDCFLPVTLRSKPMTGYIYAGLYVEMKRQETLKPGERKDLIIDRAAGKTSDEQDAFIGFARRQGYAVAVCFSWRDAADALEKYIRECRANG